jgi:hypothetical protein
MVPSCVDVMKEALIAIDDETSKPELSDAEPSEFKIHNDRTEGFF